MDIRRKKEFRYFFFYSRYHIFCYSCPSYQRSSVLSSSALVFHYNWEFPFRKDLNADQKRHVIFRKMKSAINPWKIPSSGPMLRISYGKLIHLRKLLDDNNIV